MGLNRDDTDGRQLPAGNPPFTLPGEDDKLSSQDDVRPQLPPGAGMGGFTLRASKAIVASAALTCKFFAAWRLYSDEEKMRVAHALFISE